MNEALKAKNKIAFILIWMSLFSITAIGQKIDGESWEKGKKAYDSKSYEEAVLHIDKHLNSYPIEQQKTNAYLNAKAYLAGSLQRTKKSKRYLTVLEEIIQSVNKQSQWKIYESAQRQLIEYYLFRFKNKESQAEILKFIDNAKKYNEESCFDGYQYYLNTLVQDSLTNRKEVIENLINYASNEKMLSTAYTEKAIAFDKVNQDSAIYYYTKALDLAKEINDSTRIATCLSTFGNFYSFANKYDLANEYLISSIEYTSSKKQYDLKRINHYTLIAENFNRVQNNDKALEYFQFAIDLAEERGYKMRNGNLARSFGEFLTLNGRYEQATEELKRAAEYYKKRKDVEYLASVLTMLGRTHYRNKNYQEAQVIYDSLSLLDLKKFPIPKFRKLFLGAELDQYNNKPQQAIKKLQQALKISKQIGSKADELATSRFLADLYTSTGQYKLANSLRERHMILSDSIYNKNMVNRVLDFEALYKKKEQDLAITELNNQNLLKDARIDQQKSMLQTGLIALLVFLILLFIIIILYRRLSTQNLTIKTALNEKDILLREIHHRVKNNLQVISSLLSLQSRQIDNQQIKQAINEGRNRVRSMALIHQNLYEQESLTGISVQSYLK